MVFPLWDDNPFVKPVLPWVTWGLIAVNLIVYLVEASYSDAEMRVFFATYGTVPSAVAGNAAPPPGAVPPWLSLITYQFVHGDFWHVVGNMIFLFVFGDDIEEAVGPLKFLGFYLLCGIVGALVFVATDPKSFVPLVGASGAVSGVISAYLMVRPCAKVAVFILRIVVRLAAYWVIGGWILMQLYSLSSNDGVAYWAHLGGLVAGAVLLPVLRRPGVELFQCIREGDAPSGTA